ncbi:STAS domain-containing protein [Planctomycetota bacterium]|nr:STAS domain-containing protein [Planctomycetota bacterium]
MSEIPVITLAGNLIVSIQVDLTDESLERLKEAVGDEIERRAPGGLVIDVSGLAVMDSYITRGLCDLAGIARLMGVRTLLCGLRPQVAITLVEMGIELEGIQTALSLDAALLRLHDLRMAEEDSDDVDHDLETVEARG